MASSFHIQLTEYDGRMAAALQARTRPVRHPAFTRTSCFRRHGPPMRHPRLPLPAFLAVALLTGCVTPSPPMWYAERALVRVGGLDYVVFHSGARAEATRVSGAPGL